MIDYYTARTLFGNSRKVSIMFAETGIEHIVHFVDLEAGDQHKPNFLTVNPNGRIPVIVDREVAGGLALAESGAILIYLADLSGRFLATTGAQRAQSLQWLFWQTSSVGPMLGQWMYFERTAPERIPSAIARYREEANRLMNVLDARLCTREYVTEDYSIADMALYPWIAPAFTAIQAVAPEHTSQWLGISRWLETMAKRPAVALAMSRYEGTAQRVADLTPTS